ncbi:hypothetical protein COCNU_13G000550 [Cocos nucifera]|uniref:Uncharacterized protein n=1 Tax=Cocos nucifera TaxID=13894 RepID=A0A8K0ISU2_COCNU|nr:hypothetical protein COCNU_13G000550 [Cocos nucifera]
MASEAGILESIAEKKVQDETGDFGCAQIHNPPEYTNKPLEVLKEHSNESEIKGGLTDSAVLQSSQMIGQYPPYEAVTATGESSTLSESSNDQSAHSVTVGITDSSEGEVFVEAPPRVQVHLEDICNGSNAGIHGENPINKEKEKLENGNMLRKDQKDELEEEKDMTVPKNSSSEANFTDASLHTAAVTNVPLEEKMQRNESNDFGNDHPVKKSDEHIFESTGANQNTEKADVLGEEKTSTGIHENSVVNQYQDLENLGDKVDDKQLEKSINLGHEKQDFEAIKDQEKPETQESTENLSVNPERLPLPEDLGETGLQKEDEENDRFDDLSGPLSEEQCDKDDQRVSMENYHEKEDIIGIVSSNETSQSQNIASVKDKEEKLEESSFLASEEKILESLDITEKVSEIQYGKTSADASLKELSNLKLSAEESALEDDMSSDTVKKLSFKEQEPIQRTRVIIIETETSKEETHTEMDPHKCTSQMKKEPEESNFIEDSMADKDVECISLVSTEKSPGTSYASKNIENENLDESKQDGWMDASISTKVEVPGIQNDQVSIMTHKETYNVLYEENGLQANDPMDAGDDFKKGENLNEQAKAKSEEEKFEEVCRVVEALDTRETVATAISMDEPHVVSAEDIIQDQETTHSRNEKENEVQEEEETNYRNIDASGSKQLTDEIQSLNEEKKAQKFEEISEVVQDKDHCHEKALNQDDLKAQTTVSDTPEVSKTQNEKGIQEHEDKDGIHVDKIERAFEEKHVEAIAETKPSNHIKASEKGHAQEAVSVDIKEHADETINDGTLGPERKKDETDGAKLENDFIVVSKEVEVTEGIANAEKENIDSKSPMNIEVIPKDDEAMCRNIEKVAAELIHEYQTTMTNDLSETGILIEKSDISEENVGDLPVAHKLEETIQVCENMDHIKQELEPANVEEYSKSASRHQSQMTIADTEATDLDSSGDGVSMDKTLSASSTIQASILGDSQKATDSEEAEEKICEKTNKNIGHDKHLEESPEKEAQKDIHKKIEDDKRVEDIILGDDQIDKTKAGLSSNQEQMEGRKLDKGDELKQGKETNEAAVNREICLEENPIVDAPENVHEDDKWGNKLEKPSDEIFVKIIMAQDSASNKEDLEKKGSPEEKEESSQKKGEAGVTLEQTVDRLHTKDLSNKPHGKDEKTSNIIGQNGDAEPARVKDEARIDSCVDELKQGKETNEAVVNREIEENPIADAPENVQEDDKWGSKLEKPSDDISVKISITQDSASNKEDLEKRGSLEEKEESSQEKREAGVTFKQTIDKLDTKDPSHKPHGKDEKTSSIIGQNGDAEPARVKDEAGNDSSVDELKQGKETDETVVNREIYLEENLIVDATKNIQKDDKWGNKFEKPSDEISVKVTMAQDSASNKEDVEKKGTPEEKQQSSQKKGEAGVTLDQIVDRLDTKDPSHKPDGKDEKTSSIIGQNGDAEPARVKDEAQDDSSVDELKQGKETDEALMNREICLEENPIVDAPEDDKWRNKLEKPSDEISMKIMMAQDSASNKEDVEKKGSLEEKKESSHEKGEAGVTLEQIVDRLDTKNPSLKPHGIDEKTSSIIGQNGDAEAARVKDEVQNGSSVEELKQGKETDEATVNREICLEENLIVDAPKNVQEDHKWGKKLEKPSDEISVKIMAQDSASNKEDVEKKGSLEEKKESSQEKGEAGVTLEQIVDGLDTEDPSHKPHGKDEKTSSIMGQNSDAEPTRVKDGAQNDSSVDELKQGKETNEDVVDREICLEKNSIVDAPENDQEDDKWGNKLEKPSDEISMKIIMAQDSASNKENLEKKGSPKEKEESSQEKDEAGVTLEQTVDKLDIEDPSHKAHGKDEKTSSIIGQNDDAEPAGVKDEARNVSSFDVSDTHELVGQCIDDLEGSKHEEVSNSDYEDQINEYTDTKGNKVVDDRERAPQKIEEISVSEDKNREITCETEATKIENLNTDYNLNNMVSETINTNGDNETAKPMNEEFLEKNIKDTPDSHTLATQEIHDAAGEKPESETIIESEEQIHQTTSNKDNIDTDICKEKADSGRLDSISESIPEDQSGESDAPKVDNLADELVGQCIDDLEGSKHAEVSNSNYEDQIDEYTSTKGNKVVDDREKAPQKIEEISVSEDKNREITCETKAAKIESLNTDYNLNNMVSEMINTNGDNETAKSMNEEFLEKNIKDTPDSHTLATQEIHDAAGEKPESETIIESEEQINQTTSNKDNIDTDICKEKADSDRLDSISESMPGDQSGESDVPNVDNLADELVRQCIDDLEGSMHEEVSNSDYEDQIDEYTDTKGNKVVDDHEKASQKIEEISVSEDKNREITCETEATKIENLNTDYNLNNMVFETINTNGDNETAKSMNKEFLEKNIKDTPDSHSLATQEIHDAAEEKPESETIIESEEQIHQTTSNKDNIDTDICKEKADFNRLDSISESILEDQSGESDAPKVDNLADDDKLKNPENASIIDDIQNEKMKDMKDFKTFGISSVSVVKDQYQETTGESEATKSHKLTYDDNLNNMIPAMGDLNDDHETAKVRYESILETSMDTISDSHASVLEKTYGRFDEKHKAPNLMSEEQIHQATNTEENKQVSVYNENIDIKRLEIVVKSGPEDQSPDKMTSKIEKTLDEDTINDTVNSLSILQASIEHTLQEEENPTVYAETIGVHKSTDHSISEEDKSSDSKSSGSSLDQSADRSVLKEEFNNDAILGSSLKHDVIENACELESEGKQHEAPKEKETSDIVLEESHGMTSDALERSTENLKGKQMIWEKEASENKASLSTECDFVEEGFQEDKEETKIMDLAPESAYNNKNNETNEVNDSMKSGIANKEVETSDDDKSHKASCSGKEYMLIKLQSEDNENANTKDEESTNNRANTNALGSEAASGSLHRGQRESITREEETIRNTKLDQEAASDLTSVEQHLEVIIKTDLANIDILEEDKCNLVAQYLESEVVNAKDEECISKTDGDLPTMPVPAKEVRWEIEEKHEKHPNYEEQIHERSITNNTMDNDALEEDKNIEEVERDVVRVPEEQSHEGTTTTGIIENEILKVALSASQKFDEEKTSKIAFLSEGNEHSCEAGEVCKKATCTLLKEAISIVEAASGTSMQSEVGADELNEDHISVFNRKFESLYPEKNQEEETPTRERASDACIAAPYNLVPVEPAFAARAQNMVDLNIEEWKAAKIMGKEVKDSVLACHENSQTSAETKSTENGPKDDALTVKTNSVEQNMQKDAHWVGSEDHIHDATEDHETTKCVALENRNKEEMEERKTLQSKKMEDEKQKERKELQADMEISEAFYPSECNNESLEEKGTLNKGSEKETLEVVELEKPLNAFNKMEESEFTDRFVPNKEEPEVERSLQAKEMKDEKQEEENKIQSKEKISEADNTSKCNKESSEEKRISERGAEKQKPDYVELENLQNVVPEELEVAYQTENINSDGQEKEVTDGSLEAGFHKKEDKALEEIVIELDVVNHCNEPNRDSDATEGVLEQEKILEVVDFSATKENQIKMFGRSSIKSDLVEEIKDVEPSGSHLQKESVESKALETEEKFESISFEEEPKKNEKLSVGSQNDANKVIQVEEVSNMVFDRLPTAGSSEKTEKKITSEDVEAPDVAHVRDKPFHEQIQGDENKTEIKKAETKWELEETDTIVNGILNDKVKELGYMPSKKNHAKVELPEKMDTTSPVDEEEPTKNVEFSSIKASSSEIMQDVSENLDKESVPKESTQIDAKTKVMGLEFANNMMNDEEGPIEIEKFEHISTNSVSVDRTCNRNSITPDANEKGEEAIDKEDREKLEEASNSVSNEKVDEWDDSLAAFIEDKDNSPNTPIKQATEVTTSADEKEMTWQTEGETHEKVRDFGNSENEENQQTDQDDLPVSRFLMDRILQEEGDKLAEACEAKCEDKLQVNIHDQQNDVNILKQERNSDSLSVEQEKDDTSISEGKVEDLIKIEGSSDLVQQSHDLKKDTENAILKDDETPDRNLHDTSLTLAAGEDLKDELSHLFDKELTNIISDNNMELVLAEECSPESKVDVDELKKLDNIIPIPAPEMMMESIIQKDDKSLKKNSDVATVIKAFEEDTLNKEGGKESPEISQDIAENDQASHATAEKQTPSVAEPVGNAKGEIQLKETVPNIQGDQPEKSFQSSSIEDSTLGEALETQSGGIKVKTGKENQDGTAESQMKNVKNNLSEELKVSDSHKVQQTEPIVEHTNETIQAGERFLTERSPAVSADEKHAKEIGDAHMKEEKNGEEKDEKEEEDENKTEESGHDAAIVVEARNADVKPAHKKSHNILSGVGSKVKHSIAKVKKAITGKSSHSKTQS